jgi:hypothetical protein
MFRLRQMGKRFQKSSDRLTVVRLFPEGRISTGNESRRRLQSFDLRLRMLSWMLSDSSPCTGQRAPATRPQRPVQRHPVAGALATRGGSKGIQDAPKVQPPPFRGHPIAPLVCLPRTVDWGKARCALAASHPEHHLEAMTPKRVLIVSYYWPPSGGGGVQRWLKFAKLLP